MNRKRSVDRAASVRRSPGAVGARYHHGSLRRALLDAALAVIVEAGPHRLSLRETARRAGVSHAAPYRHFKGRAALIEAIAAEGFDALARALDTARTAGQDPATALSGMARAYVRFALEQPARFRVMFGAEAGSAMGVALGEASERVRHSLSAALAACAPEQHATLDITPIAWSLLHGVATLAIEQQLALVGLPEELAARGIARLLR